MATTTIRETESYRLFQDEAGNSAIFDKVNNCQTKWKVGEQVRNETNHIKHLDDEGFDNYCLDVINAF